jgi:hypothetical protein
MYKLGTPNLCGEKESATAGSDYITRTLWEKVCKARMRGYAKILIFLAQYIWIAGLVSLAREDKCGSISTIGNTIILCDTLYTLNSLSELKLYG